MRQLNTGIVAKRKLATFLYQEASPTQKETQDDVLKELESYGFSVNHHRLISSSMEKIWDFIQTIEKDRISSLMISMVLLLRLIA